MAGACSGVVRHPGGTRFIAGLLNGGDQVVNGDLAGERHPRRFRGEVDAGGLHALDPAEGALNPADARGACHACYVKC